MWESLSTAAQILTTNIALLHIPEAACVEDADAAFFAAVSRLDARSSAATHTQQHKVY